jgi:UDP-N-acetylglucosamine 1-carboxyvinyltransferase
MDAIRIKGGQCLKGQVQISGAKNAALPIFAASLLTEKPCIIENVPNLSDIHFMAEVLRYLGASVEKINHHTWKITAEHIDYKTPYELVRKMRASVCLIGPLVARLGICEISLPGGCLIGQRPIDLHLKGLRKMGCEVSIQNGYVHVQANQLKGEKIFLGGRHGSTVTGTANILMAAVLTPGITKIESAACEPEIVDLCNMLCAMGANIQGIGSHHIQVQGVKQLKGCHYKIIADRIEAGTFLIAGAITNADLSIHGANPDHISALIDKLQEANVNLSINDKGTIFLHADSKKLCPVALITLPYPGFPTDLQAQMCALMSVTPGLSIITERVYPHRFMHISELQRMGADIAIEGPSAIINGREKLSGAPVMASDLRASAALIIAGLAAEKETLIQRIYHLDRGYETIDEKLNALGANIERITL